MKRVVVTGMGALTPIGNTVKDYLEGLKKGISGAGKITRFDASNFKTHFACEVKDFNVEDFIERKEARKMDLFAQFGMIATDEAFIDAGIDIEKINQDRAGVIWGSGIGGLGSLEKEIEEFITGSGNPRYNPFMIPKMISDIVAGLISIKYSFRGINYATVSACATSTHSMINAADYIRLGKADIIISGGSEAAITKAGIGGFNAMRALSTRNDDPQTASRPFDADRDGFVLGEGAGAIVLEDYEHAVKRGAKIYAEVMGSGMTADAYHITAPQPDGHGVIKVMQFALEDAKMDKSEIDYVNVHGTSTPLGDVAELIAIEKVFGDHAYELNVSSTKSMTGHLLGAAGAIEAIACILGINNNFVPPTINNFTRDPKINPKLNLTLNEAQERPIKTALCNTFGFGGHNSSVILKKFED